MKRAESIFPMFTFMRLYHSSEGLCPQSTTEELPLGLYRGPKNFKKDLIHIQKLRVVNDR